MKTLLILSALAATGIAGIAAAQITPPAPTAPMKPRHMGQDANGDGVITRQEALDAAGKRFDRMDTNHDGKIDATEAQAMRQMRRGGMRGGYGGGGDMPPPPQSPPPSGTPDGE